MLPLTRVPAAIRQRLHRLEQSSHASLALVFFPQQFVFRLHSSKSFIPDQEGLCSYD